MDLSPLVFHTMRSSVMFLRAELLSLFIETTRMSDALSFFFFMSSSMRALSICTCSAPSLYCISFTTSPSTVLSKDCSLNPVFFCTHSRIRLVLRNPRFSTITGIACTCALSMPLRLAYRRCAGS